ncbi:AcrR family transcriptional regulator [Streptomyces sp. SAI-144]|uniref:TetR/AcrR family transcriptional regulator n=1 Tax=unclassified Streptomyces TaxID=2593676 RepID=UPI002475A377|nr:MULTISPECIES: TetR/AcrR family transcriptional regulator C-terminal domain-containing protein [unclassified Streptomyces]MDH6435228.1 AcrR family transcriptional regulator [Streptomyces sp. SAI-144]MDH6489321.1 AcrR family transcriptional regulator [Streptomyces sp. SAI-127]
MTTYQATPTPLRAGSAEERQAVVRAARAVFAREGWTHAGVADIAMESGLDQAVVTHYFQDKERLLLTVLLEGAAAVAAELTVIAENHLAEITDLEQDLVALGHAWLTPLAAFPEHFAIVRHLAAEVAAWPAGVVEMWRTAGPRQATRELARRLDRLAERGLLAFGDAGHDPEQAAERFIQLVAGGVVQRSFHGALPLADFETDALVTAGVADFVRLYRPGADR